ncbi:MAG: 30S ribosomal protein S12 methylthiotransferase RimO [Polyangia bacterium]
MPAPSVYFVSLGCPKNRVDTEVMLGMADESGHRITLEPENADVIVVNTCGFIGAAKEESVDTILEMAEFKKTGRCRRLVVTGCLSQRYPDELHREIPEIDHILGSGEVDKVAQAIRGSEPAVDVAQVPAYLYDHTTPRPASQAHFFRYVKIAEGCDRPCGFCIIPKLRGPQRSRKIDSIAAEVDALSAQGVVEVNLVAQDLTTYGTDLPFDVDHPDARPSLANLLRRIGKPPKVGSSPDHLRWIRLHYTYPTATTDELLQVMAESPRVVRYIDCPLQHIDDKLLKLMRRGYTGKSVYAMVERAKKHLPGLFLRTAFIVGHPGETDAAFQKLCDFVQEVEIDHVGVFTYSPEDGTPSAELPDAVPAKVAEQRRRELLRLQRKVAKKKRKELFGKRIEVLVEGPSDESEFVLKGRHAGQAPEIDGHVYLTVGETNPDVQLRPGDLILANVLRGAEYDLVAEVDSVVQPAFRPQTARKLPVIG